MLRGDEVAVRSWLERGGRANTTREHGEVIGITLLMDAARQAVEEDYAESIILGCTMEVGFHKRIEDQMGVPCIDPSIAALKRAEYGALLKRDCGWKPSRKWSCEAPPESEIAEIGAFDSGEFFGPRIVVGA